jgi:hypothetical protein
LGFDKGRIMDFIEEYRALAKELKNYQELLGIIILKKDKAVPQTEEQLFEQIYRESQEFKEFHSLLKHGSKAIENRLENINEVTSGLLTYIDINQGNNITDSINTFTSGIIWDKKIYKEDQHNEVENTLIKKGISNYKNWLDGLWSIIRKIKSKFPQFTKNLKLPDRIN